MGERVGGAVSRLLSFAEKQRGAEGIQGGGVGKRERERERDIEKTGREREKREGGEVNGETKDTAVGNLRRNQNASNRGGPKRETRPAKWAHGASAGRAERTAERERDIEARRHEPGPQTPEGRWYSPTQPCKALHSPAQHSTAQHGEAPAGPFYPGCATTRFSAAAPDRAAAGADMVSDARQPNDAVEELDHAHRPRSLLPSLKQVMPQQSVSQSVSQVTHSLTQQSRCCFINETATNGCGTDTNLEIQPVI